MLQESVYTLMYIIKSVSQTTGYTYQGTHAFPTKETAQHFLDINGKIPGIIYYIIEAPVGTPQLAINDVQINNYRFVRVYQDNSDLIKRDIIYNLNLISYLDLDIARIQSEIKSN